MYVCMYIYIYMATFIKEVWETYKNICGASRGNHIYIYGAHPGADLCSEIAYIYIYGAYPGADLRENRPNRIYIYIYIRRIPLAQTPI